MISSYNVGGKKKIGICWEEVEEIMFAAISCAEIWHLLLLAVLKPLIRGELELSLNAGQLLTQGENQWKTWKMINTLFISAKFAILGNLLHSTFNIICKSRAVRPTEV